MYAEPCQAAEGAASWQNVSVPAKNGHATLLLVDMHYKLPCSPRKGRLKGSENAIKTGIATCMNKVNRPLTRLSICIHTM